MNGCVGHRIAEVIDYVNVPRKINFLQMNWYMANVLVAILGPSTNELHSVIKQLIFVCKIYNLILSSCNYPTLASQFVIKQIRICFVYM